ncbi:MAG: hypothetical protein J5494_07070 [Candidatus Methanomethylophilaceae archaeon]|nr:hypothetical protein [Candidatus Methanomethylophilaceae archaeon]
MLTVEDLALAIKNGFDRQTIQRGDGMGNMGEDEAYDLAHRVLNFFGYSDRIIDNVLESQDRGAFYQLEDVKILTTEREETTLYDGREWRIHYWLFKRDTIDELMSSPAVSDRTRARDENVYSQLEDDVWLRNRD